MNRDLALTVANAVLYEGYILYPYRPSAIKNRQRWSFGILYPPAYAEVLAGTERSAMHVECLIEAGAGASVRICVRFLQLLTRHADRPGSSVEDVSCPSPVPGELVEMGEEGIERTQEFEIATGEAARSFRLAFSDEQSTESLGDNNGREIGKLTRTQYALDATVSAATQPVGANVWKLTLAVSNQSAFSGEASDRMAAMLSSLLSAHLILATEGGNFVSLLDPTEDLRTAANACVNVGNFPVLVGDHGERKMLLCSPILLYDYPQVAPESAGDFYDATEIDEMLTLRLMTLTEGEKSEMRRAGDRARALLQRTEHSPREQLARTHGTMRAGPTGSRR